ncbi:hypothetical protein [uncultured Nocardioides sp.]|uniref:hypothetical protein n=1 Tax=uncultured Nocardioides sp. TaxID=198441 RepID=UPI0032B1C538
MSAVLISRRPTEELLMSTPTPRPVLSALTAGGLGLLATGLVAAAGRRGQGQQGRR